MTIRLRDLTTAPHPIKPDRRLFIGGSDARIIMSPDQEVLIRLWREKRGEVEPTDLSDNLVVQLGVATEGLNRSWYERNTGRIVGDVQRWVQHPVHRFLAATLDGMVEHPDAVFEAKFMLPWSFSEEAAAEKHMAQLQHNMWVTNARFAALSIITGGGKWIEMTIPADALYQHFLITAERRFWRCVQTGETPRPYGIEPPRPRVEAVRIVDMGESNSWAQFAGLFCTTRSAFLDHERAKSELKALMPEDAKEASGHGVRAKRSKSGAVSLDPAAKGSFRAVATSEPTHGDRAEKGAGFTAGAVGGSDESRVGDGDQEPSGGAR
jgi:YqaJ-like viral recombinase domain